MQLQTTVLLLILVASLDLLLLAEGQEFGGCRVCSKLVPYYISANTRRTGSRETCTGGRWFRRRRCTRVATYYYVSKTLTRQWTQKYCCPDALFPNRTTADGTVRLMDGAAQNEGRIEVNYKGVFGSVCGDSFGTSEAATVCHQLGFAGVSRVAPCCQFGQTSGEIWLDNVDCGTGKVWLANCTHRGWGVEDCHHGQDVGVVCNGALSIRLAGGGTGFEGRVEQYYAGSWSTVCDDDWDLNDAKVVCRQLGLGGAVRATTGSFFGRGTGRTILSNVDCTGNETALGWCLHSGWISRSRSQTAGVVCEGPKPNNVSLVGTTNSSIVVTCSIPPQLQFVNNITEWKVTLQREGFAKTVVTSTFTAPSTQLTVNHLLPATRYTVWVSVKAGSAEGPLSEAFNVTTQEGAPGPVASISASPVSATSVQLSWTPPLTTKGVLTSYHIEYQSATGSGISDNGEVDLSVSTTSYTVTGLEENTLYHFTVSADNGAGRGVGSTVSVRTSIARPSSPPREVSVEVQGPNSVEVTWQAPPLVHHNGAILSYIIRYFPSNESDMTQDFHVTADGGEAIQRKTLSNLEPFTRYSFRVSAVNAAGAGPFSVAVERTTEKDVPGIVESLGGRGFSTSIELSWAPPTQSNGIITGYFLTYSTGSGELSSENIPASVTSYTVTGLEENTLYHFTVSAETSAGRGEGRTVSVRTLPDAPDGAPREVTANVTGPTTVALSWQAPHMDEQNGRLLSYTLEYSISEPPGAAQEISVPVNSSGGGNQERVVEGLQPYKTYQFRVRAVNEVGEGPFSNPVVIITPEDVPGPVESFTATTVSSSAIHLSWTPPLSPNGRITGYRLIYSASLPSGAVHNGSEFIRSSSAGVLAVSDLEEDVLYQFTLRAKTSAGEGEGKTTSAKTKEDVPSAAPQHISVSASTSRSAVVRWRDPPLDDQNGQIVHYVVRYLPADDRSSVREEEVEAAEGQDDVIEHVVDQLQPFTAYEFAVAAATAAGQGPFSNPSSVRMPQDVPSKVRELTVRKEAAGSLAFSLTWEPPASPNGIIRFYKVYSNNSEVASLHPNQTSFTLTQLTPGTLYIISVGAFTDAGEGEREERMITTDGSTATPTADQLHTNNAEIGGIGLPAGAAGGAVVLLIVILLVVIGVCLCKRYKRVQGYTTRKFDDPIPPPPELPTNHDKLALQHLYEEIPVSLPEGDNTYTDMCSPVDGDVAKGVEENREEEEEEEKKEEREGEDEEEVDPFYDNP